MPSFHQILQEQIDYIVLTLVAVLIFGMLHRWLWRGHCSRTMKVMIWWLVATVLVSGWFFMNNSLHHERLRLQQAVEGFSETAMAGKPAITRNPYPDRWATGASSAVPERKAQGTVEAVPGMDDRGKAWVAAVNRSKLTAIASIAVLLMILAAGSAFLINQNERHDLRIQVLAQEGLRVEKKKLETLINSIDGIVWESDAESFKFTYVSRQSQIILGYSPEEWMADDRFWAKILHPEDQWAHAQSERLVALRAPYSFEYRMISADHRTVWIRESAEVLVDDDGELLLVCGIYHDITQQKLAAEELEKNHAALLKSSHLAGMAEVATGVLHNVGNVLNSVNVSASLVSEKLHRSQAFQLEKVAALLSSRQDRIPEYLTRDPEGKKLPEYLEKLGQHLVGQNNEVLSEMDHLSRNIEHINKIVTMQQSYARLSEVYEILPLDQLVEDAISVNQAAFERHKIIVTRHYNPLPPVPVDRHRVLQILVNLISNAKHALDAADSPHKIIRISIARDGDFANISIADNGIGIPPENLASIFRHGFTTRNDGHGFGLHSSANSAAEMNGSLSVQSGGPGQGASFTLGIPLVHHASPAA